MPATRMESAFPQNYKVEILERLPMLIEEPRQFVYPKQAEEVERGALLLRIVPENSARFVAVCALGFDSPSVVTGIYGTPHPDWLCAVCGGYAYLVNVREPEKWRFVPSRPVLEVRAAVEAGALLFVDFQTISGFTAGGALWQTAPLSWEGIRIEEIGSQALAGYGWEPVQDRDLPFTVDLMTGRHTGGAMPKVIPSRR